MRVLIALLLLTTSVHAAPLYLSCKGETYFGKKTEGDPSVTDRR
jgi:hypothetical protein